MSVSKESALLLTTWRTMLRHISKSIECSADVWCKLLNVVSRWKMPEKTYIKKTQKASIKKPSDQKMQIR